MPNKIFMLLILFMMGSGIAVKGQNSSVTPDYIKSNLIQFLKSENVIDDASNIGMSFYLIDLNTSVDSSNSHVVFPVEIKPEPTKALQIGFYKFGISSPHLEPHLVVVCEESFDIFSDYSVPKILSKLESFMRERSMGFEKQLMLSENVLNVLNQRHRILETMTPIEDDLIFDHENK